MGTNFKTPCSNKRHLQFVAASFGSTGQFHGCRFCTSLFKYEKENIDENKCLGDLYWNVGN